MTAYADDVSVINGSVGALQDTLDEISIAAICLGLKLNAQKCACLVMQRGKTAEACIAINSVPIRCLGPDYQDLQFPSTRLPLT